MGEAHKRNHSSWSREPTQGRNQISAKDGIPSPLSEYDVEAPSEYPKVGPIDEALRGNGQVYVIPGQIEIPNYGPLYSAETEAALTGQWSDSRMACCSDISTCLLSLLFPIGWIVMYYQSINRLSTRFQMQAAFCGVPELASALAGTVIFALIGWESFVIGLYMISLLEAATAGRYQITETSGLVTLCCCPCLVLGRTTRHLARANGDLIYKK